MNDRYTPCYITTVSLAFILLILFSCPLAIAAEIPTGLQPGVSERQFQPRPEPKSTRKIILPAPAEQPAPEDAGKVTFTLRQMQISGSTVFSVEELQPFYAEYLGKEISLQVLFDIAGAITRYYTDAGYALSVAYVPAQEIDDNGQVIITVTEGYIATIEYSGAVDSLSPRNQRRLQVLTTERPLTVATLEQQLLLVNDSPGITVVTTLDRGETGVGATKLQVEVNQKKYDLYANVNNRGSKSQGQERYEFGGAINQISGADDRLSASLKHTFAIAEQRYYALGYSRLLNDQGTTLSFDINNSTGEPGLEFLEALDYETKSQTYQIGISHPFKRSRTENLSLFGQFNLSNNESEILGETASEANIRSLRIGIDYDTLDRFGGQNWVRVTLSQGLDIFNATDANSDLNSRAAAKYDYTAIRADLFRTQYIGNNFSYFVQSSFQFSADQLVANEQCSYGGNFFGRAYDSSEISGDHCAMAGVELRWRAPVTLEQVNSLQPYLFWSGGRTWLKGGEDNSAQDAGFGVRARIFKYHNLYVELAQPLNRDVALEGDRNARIFSGWRINY